MEGFDFYISSEGYLHIPKYDIEYLVDFYESNIPSMPEATESSVRIAGKDGDISLKTTYEPMSFEIVCYTDDNLTPKEKSMQESKVNQFLNSIKDNTIPFGIERDEKFYDVKYIGNLIATRFPKHIKFTIPLKASNPYAKYYLQREEIAETEFESNTIKEAGAIFTIYGPVTNPKIALNNYQMSYQGTILEGNRLEINSNNSTITLITSDGSKTNAMRYYNHQFPKIQQGLNYLTLQSGNFTSSEQVSIKWYDLKL